MAFNLVQNPLGSIAFTATQWVSSPATSAFTLSTGNWTMECWFRSTNNTGVFGQILGFRGTLNGGFGAVCLINSSGTLVLYSSSTSSGWDIANGSSCGAITLNTWYHMAAVRNGSSLVVYVNGTAVLTISLTSFGSAFSQTSQPLFIGGDNYLGGPSDVFTGQVSNVRFVKGVAVYTGNFTPPTAPLTATQAASTNISAITAGQTSWLLQTPNNTAWLGDSSIFGYTASTAGTTTASALTPLTVQTGNFSPVGSLLFATASAVRYTNSAFAVGTGTFTAECWVYPTASAGSTAGFLSTCTASSAGFIIAKDVVGVFGAGGSGGSSFAGTIPASTWSHIAIVRSGSSLSVYVNGVSRGAAVSNTISMAGQVAGLGERYADDVIYNFVGYITNVRFVAGVAVYTGNFTVPASPLQITQSSGSNISAITGSQTSLLCSTPNNASYLADSSNYNLTATVVGTVTSDALSAFSSQTPMITATTTPLGSVSFNGTSQYLTAASNAAYDFGTGDFTVEFWAYFNTTTGADRLLVERWSSNSGWQIYYRNSVSAISFLVGGTVALTDPSTTRITTSTWYHIAVTRSGTTAYMFINGVLVTSGTLTGSLSNAFSVAVGVQLSTTSLFFNGYISNLRIAKGVAVYTSGFTPPTAPLPGTQAANSNGNPSTAVTPAQTALLLQTPNNANFIADSSANNFTVTNVGTATASSLTPFSAANSAVWGGPPFGSLSLNGTSQYVSIPANTAAFSYSTNDFTWECWVYPTAYGAAAGSTIDFWSNASGSYIVGQCQLQVNPAGTVQFYYATAVNTFTSIVTTTTLSLNTWYHLAVVRSGSGTGNLKIYINGVLAVSSAGAVTQALGSTGAGAIGRQTNVTATSYFFTGYISNPRIVNGVAVYTGTFTPPVQPLNITQSAGTNIAAITGTQTSLLLNTPNTTGFLEDSSTNNFTLTNNGTMSANSTTPFTTVNGPVTVSYTAAVAPLGSANTGSGVIGNTATSAAFSLGTGDFTIEYWVYMTSVTGTKRIIGNVVSSSDTGFSMDTDGTSFGFGGWTTFTYITPAAGLSATFLNKWVHVAWVRISGVETVYLNGSVLGSVTRSLNFSGTGAVYLACAGVFNTNFPLAGYLSNIRIVKGIGVYTGAFTSPTAPLTGTQTANQNGSPSAAITSPTSTVLLLRTPSTSAYLADSSVYGLSVTSAAITASTDSPFTTNI